MKKNGLIESKSKEKEKIKHIFDKTAKIYDKIGPDFFSAFGKRLVDIISPKEKSCILDVGAGRGAIVFSLVRKLSTEATVIGIDFSSSMIKELTHDIKCLPNKNIFILNMDAENLSFKNSTFDYIFCGFSMFFFTSPVQALSEFNRVLKSNGILGISTWGDDDKNWNWYYEMIDKYEKQKELYENDYYLSFDTRQEIENILLKAGFGEIKIVAENTDVYYKNKNEWWNSIWSHGERETLDLLNPEKLKLFKDEAFRKLKYNKQHNGYCQKLEVLYTSAKKSRKLKRTKKEIFNQNDRLLDRNYCK